MSSGRPWAAHLQQSVSSNVAAQILLILALLLCPKSSNYFKLLSLKCALKMNAFCLENIAALCIMC